MILLKPVFIIAIAVVCSVVAVLGVLSVLQEIADMEFRERQQDIDSAYSYKEKYSELKYDLTCADYPPAQTWSEAREQMEIARKQLEQIALNQKGTFTDELSILESKMSLLQDKYPNSDYFTFDPVTCPYEKEWAEARAQMGRYRDELLEKTSEFENNDKPVGKQDWFVDKCGDVFFGQPNEYVEPGTC